MANEKKGITVKVDAALHAEVRQYLEQHGITMAEFIAIALDNELHPKNQQKEEQKMGNMRTLAFQIPEELFQRIKEYLARNNMTQKEFVIGLIENELEREQTAREKMTESPNEEERQDQDEAAVFGENPNGLDAANEPLETQDTDIKDSFGQPYDTPESENPAIGPYDIPDEVLGAEEEATAEFDTGNDNAVAEDEPEESQDIETNEFPDHSEEEALTESPADSPAESQEQEIGDYDEEEELEYEDKTEYQGLSMGM